jgi:hypothetical protein
LGGNYLYHAEPDFRRLRTFLSKDVTEGEWIIIDPPSASPQDLGRYYGYMNEFGVVNGLNFEKKFEGVEKDRPKILRAGYLVDYKQRDFEARYITTFFPGFHDQVSRQELVRAPIYESFAPENYRQGDGWLVQEGSRPNDIYDASTLVGAAYIGGVYPISKLILAEE